MDKPEHIYYALGIFKINENFRIAYIEINFARGIVVINLYPAEIRAQFGELSVFKPDVNFAVNFESAENQTRVDGYSFVEYIRIPADFGQFNHPVRKRKGKFQIFTERVQLRVDCNSAVNFNAERGGNRLPEKVYRSRRG